MAFTYDVATSRGQVRLLATDTDVDNPIFTDAEIDYFLTLYSDNVRRAAAKALDTIAASQVLTLKVMRLLDIQTDGAKVAASLQATAAQLREEATAFEDGASFDIAEMVVNDFSYAERINAQALRGAI